jgi:TPR repeat protein
MSHEQDMNYSYDNNQGNNNNNYYDQQYDYNYPQTNYQNQRPPPATSQYNNPNPNPNPNQYNNPNPNQYNNNQYNNPNPNQYDNPNIPNQNGSFYNNGYNSNNAMNNQPPPSVPQGQQNYSYNNRPVNFHPQAMHNGIGNQYRPPPAAKPKTNPYGGKLPMTSLGGQPMPYGQSLEMYRQNAKKSNDPHVQLEFAKYLIAMADAALDSDPDQKVARRNQEILYNEGLKWIKKLANQGGGLGKTPYAEAQFFLAECYGNGSLGLQIDHEKAFSYYLQASKQSHPPSTYRAAVCYEHGAGTKKDFQRAVQFYRKAAALGDVLSMYKLGTILLNGTINQDKNPREGLTWLKRAAAQADQSCPHALHELGMIYEGKNPETNGLIIPDPNYSQELYLKAAQFGYSPSQYKLGLCYEYGLLNLPMDSRRSIAWYSKAAEQGDPEAELALSGWYLTGAENVLKQSDKEAFLWARKAANKGLAKAEYAVGYYYEYGIGVKKDLEEAKRSYLSAASQNNKRALIRLKEMKAGYAGHGPIQGWREKSRGTGAASEECVIS